MSTKMEYKSINSTTNMFLKLLKNFDCQVGDLLVFEREIPA